MILRPTELTALWYCRAEGHSHEGGTVLKRIRTLKMANKFNNIVGIALHIQRRVAR